MSNHVSVAVSYSFDTADLMQREELLNIVKAHALGGAAAGLGIAWLPGAGSTISTVAAVAALWSMYFRINNCIGLRTNKVLLRTLASAMMSNLAQAAISFIAGAALSSLLSLTGIGGVASSIIMASMDYAVIYAGGLMYLKLLTGLMRAGQNPSDLKPEDVNAHIRKTLAGEDINAMIRKYSTEYKRGRKNGTITGCETYDQVQM